MGHALVRLEDLEELGELIVLQHIHFAADLLSLVRILKGERDLLLDEDVVAAGRGQLPMQDDRLVDVFMLALGQVHWCIRDATELLDEKHCSCQGSEALV